MALRHLELQIVKGANNPAALTPRVDGASQENENVDVAVRAGISACFRSIKKNRFKSITVEILKIALDSTQEFVAWRHYLLNSASRRHSRPILIAKLNPAKRGPPS